MAELYGRASSSSLLPHCCVSEIFKRHRLDVQFADGKLEKGGKPLEETVQVSGRAVVRAAAGDPFARMKKQIEDAPMSAHEPLRKLDNRRGRVIRRPQRLDFNNPQQTQRA